MRSVGLIMLGALALYASGCESVPEPEGIVVDHVFGGILQPATDWNNIKVFLSSPTHEDSGARGECLNPGWQENVNGRAWNYYAAAGDYYNETYAPDSPYRNLGSRGYFSIVSRNAPDGNFQENTRKANEWGAHVYIISHTNAVTGGCGTPAQYTLGMNVNGNSDSLALTASLANKVGAVTPGPYQTWCGGGSGCDLQLYELNNSSAQFTAYMELIFHSDQGSQTWFKGTGNGDRGAQRSSWRYGWAVDELLGWPR